MRDIDPVVEDGDDHGRVAERPVPGGRGLDDRVLVLVREAGVVRDPLPQVGAGPGSRGVDPVRADEVEDARRYLLAVHEHMFLEQMPASRTGDQHRHILVQLVMLASIGIVEGDRPVDGVA